MTPRVKEIIFKTLCAVIALKAFLLMSYDGKFFLLLALYLYFFRIKRRV